MAHSPYTSLDERMTKDINRNNIVLNLETIFNLDNKKLLWVANNHPVISTCKVFLGKMKNLDTKELYLIRVTKTDMLSMLSSLLHTWQPNATKLSLQMILRIEQVRISGTVSIVLANL